MTPVLQAKTVALVCAETHSLPLTLARRLGFRGYVNYCNSLKSQKSHLHQWKPKTKGPVVLRVTKLKVMLHGTIFKIFNATADETLC